MFHTLCKAPEEILGMDQTGSPTSRESKSQQLFQHHLFWYFTDFSPLFMSFEVLAISLCDVTVTGTIFLSKFTFSFYQNALILAGDFISLY